MSREPSTATGSPIPSEPRPPQDGDWDRQLAAAFAVLLGRPLGEYDPDATYAACVAGNLLYEVGFRRDPAWVRPEALRGAEPVVWDCALFDDAERSPLFDASGSIFDFSTADDTSPALPADFAAALGSACFARILIRGADLAPLVAQYGIDLAAPAHADTWTVFVARLASDGTLPDALRTALATGRTPEDLIPFTAEPDEEWADALASITHPELRAHLGYFCTDGEEGLMPLGADATACGLEDEGCAPIAAWEDGHGQVDIAILQLSPLVAGPHPSST
ncbi:hypothetical protein [Streptomyces sp. NPDC048057]|uniref:hypothetical protein n=1 Tax=Streptomyces sp. NPDC048057 TaxID=3155628 RepID=UPI0033DDBA9D